MLRIGFATTSRSIGRSARRGAERKSAITPRARERGHACRNGVGRDGSDQGRVCDRYRSARPLCRQRAPASHRWVPDVSGAAVRIQRGEPDPQWLDPDARIRRRALAVQGASVRPALAPPPKRAAGPRRGSSAAWRSATSWSPWCPGSASCWSSPPSGDRPASGSPAWRLASAASSSGSQSARNGHRGERLLRSRQVRAGFGVDANHRPGLDEVRYGHDEAGLRGSGLQHVGDGRGLHARGHVGHLEIHGLR